MPRVLEIRRHVDTFPLQSAGMAGDEFVRWAAAGKPLRPVFACAVPGVEAQARDNDKGVPSACVHGDPSSRAVFRIGAQFLGWRGGIHSADGMEHERYSARAIVCGIVEILVSPSVSVRFADQFVSGLNCYSHRQRRGGRRHGVSIFQRSCSTRNVMIHIRWGTNAPAQNEGEKAK